MGNYMFSLLTFCVRDMRRSLFSLYNYFNSLYEFSIYLHEDNVPSSSHVFDNGLVLK